MVAKRKESLPPPFPPVYKPGERSRLGGLFAVYRGKAGEYGPVRDLYECLDYAPDPLSESPFYIKWHPGRFGDQETNLYDWDAEKAAWVLVVSPAVLRRALESPIQPTLLRRYPADWKEEDDEPPF